MKSETRKETLRLTRLKRQSQKCRVFELKIDESHLNLKEKEQLKMFFVEAKWLYNYILAQDKAFEYDYKTNPISVMNKSGESVTKELKYLSAKCKQDLVKRLQQSIVGLSKVKKRGRKVGRLKFKSEYNSIDLNQYGSGGTHKIVSKNRIKVVGIKRHILIHGLKQITNNYEIANAKLVKKPSGYYIKLTTFEFIKPEQLITNKKEAIGLDFGIKNNITTSEGLIFNISIGESERLKRLQLKMQRRQLKGSKNRYKTRLKIQKEYEKLDNKKKDASNKVVNYLLTNYNTVYMQDENLKGWHSGWFGKQVQHSCMGSIKAKLKLANNVKIIDRFFPTTKMCYNCGKINIIGLEERVYTCSCGLVEDRDIKAAKTVLHVGRCGDKYIPMGHRESKPVEKLTSGFLSQDKNVKLVSLKQEATAL